MKNEIPILELIRGDLRSISGNGGVKLKLKILLISHSFHLTILIRIATRLRSVNYIGNSVSILIEYLIRVLYASDISSKAHFGKNLNISHGHDIVIGSGVKIGNNNKIFNGVTLGNKNTETNLIAQPEIGDNVVLSSGAKVLGEIRIGNNVIIGANSVVTRSIPDNEVWAGVPARFIKRC